jgi:protocatechuate 3,4-dioxygenase beta subunit
MVEMQIIVPNRRHFLQALGAGAAFFTTPGLFAEALTDSKRLIRTPQLTEGPFYPDKLPLDTDNDLLIINDAITPAVGQITHVSGRVITATGQPMRNAFVEIWQCDSHASYINTHGRNPDGSFDGNFQGYGRFLTGSSGEYYFRTIKPIPYTLGGMSRTPHIHFAISQNGQRIFTTQMMIKGWKDNAHDGILNGISDAAARDTVLVDFQPVADSKIGELTAHFDIVMGVTAQEHDDGTLHGGVGKSEGPRFGPGGPGGPGGPPPNGDMEELEFLWKK